MHAGSFKKTPDPPDCSSDSEDYAAFEWVLAGAHHLVRIRVLDQCRRSHAFTGIAGRRQAP